MAFQKKETTSEEVFIIELPLCHEPWQRDRLDTAFQCCNSVKNALIAKELGKLKQMERSRKWKTLQSELADAYQAINDASAHLKKKKIAKKKQQQYEKQLEETTLKQRELIKERNAIIEATGLTKDDFEKDVKSIRMHYSKRVNSQVAQKLSNAVWISFEAYLFKKGKEIHFNPINNFMSIEGKSNLTGIIYQDGYVSFAKLHLKVCFSKHDTYGYEEQALQRDIHFCKLVRKPYPDGWRYFVQLVLSGKPPIKVNKATGELFHPLSKGRVGCDIGTQTLAVVSDDHVEMNILAEKCENIEKELRRVNRAMDRSRRATNPQMFDADGQVIRIDRLPPECLNKRERRQWVDSNRYKQLKRERRYLLWKQARLRKQQHNELANRLLSYGDDVYIEKMNYAALAKRAKETEISEKTGKYKRKKRFGKSVGYKAPASFVNTYEKKVIAAGGSFHRIDTFSAKASQYDHTDKQYKKKELSQRWNDLSNGDHVQRDLYSAFLIQNTNKSLDKFLQRNLNKKYPNFKVLHDKEIENLKKKHTPTSVGV